MPLIDSAPIILTRIETPIGLMTAGATEEGVCLLEFGGRAAGAAEDVSRLLRRGVAEAAGGMLLPSPLEQLRVELAEYFAGELRVFGVPLLTPETAFEQRVWQGLRAISYGETRTYGHIASELGDAGASRAVGAANGRNRIAILIPCHRVINSEGGLHGYGGGLDAKRWLLEHESGTLWQ